MQASKRLPAEPIGLDGAARGYCERARRRPSDNRVGKHLEEAALKEQMLIAH